MFDWVILVLSFWFGSSEQDWQERQASWWKKDPSFDAQIKDQFEPILQTLDLADIEGNCQSAHSCLAFIIITDQFARNIYRDTPEAFAYDPFALGATMYAIEQGYDLQLSPIQQTFLYMPLMHAESKEIQQLSLEKFSAIHEAAHPPYKEALRQSLTFAKAHAVIIERFGRYPHRNAILGRHSTPEEIEFLKQPNSAF